MLIQISWLPQDQHSFIFIHNESMFMMKSSLDSHQLIWIYTVLIRGHRISKSFYTQPQNQYLPGCNKSACRSRGQGFDPSGSPSHTFVELGHEIISTVILLSDTSESMCTKYWLTAYSSLPRKKCG